jgi:hypothetical protein
MLLGVKQKFASFSFYNRNVSRVERYEWRLLFYIALISNAQLISFKCHRTASIWDYLIY